MAATWTVRKAPGEALSRGLMIGLRERTELVESKGLSEPLPGAEPHRGRRTVRTFPLLPPPQKK
jgi:hypothetical protein